MTIVHELRVVIDPHNPEMIASVPIEGGADILHTEGYANLEEPVYTRPPDGAGCPKGKVWKLKKSLYGKNWHTLITSILMSDQFELHQMLTDTCLFVRRKKDGKIILLCLYVDDIYCATSTVDMQEDIIKALKSFVEIKILGVPDQLLGITLSWGSLSAGYTSLWGNQYGNSCSYATLTDQQ